MKKNVFYFTKIKKINNIHAVKYCHIIADINLHYIV